MTARVRLLPEAPASQDTTELAWIDGVVFVNARKHEQVVEKHMATIDALKRAIEHHREAVIEEWGDDEAPLEVDRRLWETLE